MGNVNKKLIKAIEAKDSKTALELANECDPLYLNKNDKSLLSYACEYNMSDVALLLIERKCDVRTVEKYTGDRKEFKYEYEKIDYDNYYMTPLLYACKNKMTVVICKLATMDSNIGYRYTKGNSDNMYTTALISLTTYASDELIMKFLELTKNQYININETIHTKYSAIGLTTNIDIVKKLIERGANINLNNGASGERLINHACRTKNTEMATLLLDSKCEVDDVTLTAACVSNMAVIVTRILDLDVSPFLISNNGFLALFKNKHNSFVKSVFEKGHPGFFKKRGGFLFAAACRMNNISIAKDLYKYKDNTTIEDVTADDWIKHHEMVFDNVYTYDDNYKLEPPPSYVYIHKTI